MIPKILHFIWIGKTVPAYVDNVLQTFQRVNPSFSVNFTRADTINDTDNRDINEVIDEIQNTSTFYNELYNSPFAVKMRKSGNLNAINSSFVDCLKFYIVNKYGGIYLDCDTFPVKPFSDDFLKNSTISAKDQLTGITDTFFMAAEPNALICNDVLEFSEMHQHRMPCKTESVVQFNRSLEKMLLTTKIRQTTEFKTGKLKFGKRLYMADILENYFFDHYRTETWR